MGALFGVQVFLHSQVLLDSWIRTTLFPFGSASLLVASSLVVVSAVRRRQSPVSVYVSKTNFFDSVSLLATGLYLLVVAGLVDVIRAIAGNILAPFVAFVLGLVALVAVFLSSELQQRTKGFLISSTSLRPSSRSPSISAGKKRPRRQETFSRRWRRGTRSRFSRGATSRLAF